MESKLNKDIDFNQLKGSAAYREKVCRMIYGDSKLKNQIFKLVTDNSGTQEEAEDIFQEAIAAFFKKVLMDQQFTLKENVMGYIYGTARNIFYGSKRNRVKYTDLNESGVKDQADDQPIGYDYMEITKEVLTYATATCQQVLMYWAANCSMREIAALMDYKSEMMARKKKHECIQKLIRFFEKNPALADKIMGHD